MRLRLNCALHELIRALAEVSDMVSPQSVNRHKRVSYVAYQLGTARGLDYQNMFDLLYAATLMHVGVLSLRERELLCSPGDANGAADQHCAAGYWFFTDSGALSNAATIIRHYRESWDSADENTVPVESHILHLADSVVSLFDCALEAGESFESVLGKVRAGAGTTYQPELVDELDRIASQLSFWFDLGAPSSTIGAIYDDIMEQHSMALRLSDIVQFSDIFRRVIDFRSEFTAAHSLAVAGVAEAIAKKSGFSDWDAQILRIAGLIHELGKLGIPAEIIEKPAQLDESEMFMMKTHPYFSFRALERVSNFTTINRAVSCHHERIDGSGYPFGLDDTDLGAGERIMALCDVFVALKEERPYRPAKTDDEAVHILKSMADDRHLDTHFVELLCTNLSEMNGIMSQAVDQSVDEYQDFMQFLMSDS